jgi:predicted nucleic acid-binding protein
MFNYYFDADRDGHEDTVRLFEAVGAGEYEGYTSGYVILELRDAPEPKQSHMLDLVDRYGLDILDIGDESERMTNLYVQNGIIPAKFRIDAAHIAVASIHGLDCVLSFNYQHINKLKTKRLTKSLNLGEGYEEITICTPMEVLN